MIVDGKKGRASLWLVVVCWLAGCKSTQQAGVNAAQDTAVKVILLPHRVYAFEGDYFSTDFPAARATGITRESDSSYTIRIAAENEPINPSPWYAFKVWSNEARNLKIRLRYVHARHRYDARISRNDGLSWEELPMDKHTARDSVVSFQLATGTRPVLVAAQEVMAAEAAYRWMDSLAGLPFVHQQVIGKSILGRPIVALNTTGSSGKKQVIVLSRQHPPEVTGYMAMQAFVQTVLSADTLAARFRRSYELILIPLLNPDGVDEGHWRHNAAGVDLNRDWDLFKQPETRAARNFLVGKQQRQGATVYFGMDFHSTYNDVFYTNEDTLTHLPGFTNRWLKGFAAAIPGFQPNVKPSGNGGNVSKSWLMRAFKADALTYEVGDDTPRELLRKKGIVAATVMMQLLLEQDQ